MALKPNIKGLNLDVDPVIQRVCEVSNDTSSSTRGVLYVLVIVCILSLIGFINTRPANWSSVRRDVVKDSILTNRKDNYTNNSDSLHRAEYFHQLENALIRNRVENYQTVKVPVLGNVFDVNDLNIVTGITFFILLFILQFTIMREINNLKIALQAITERYADDSNRETFEKYIEKHKTTDITGDLILKEINFIRRKHHYNFLSMNEIFTLPPLEVDDKNERNNFFGWIVNKIYWLPMLIYILILGNDLLTIEIGLELHVFNTIFGLVLGIICLLAIRTLCRKCSDQKKIINELYCNFKRDGYTFNKPSDAELPTV